MSHGVKNAAYFCLIKHRSLWEDYLVVCPLLYTFLVWVGAACLPTCLRGLWGLVTGMIAPAFVCLFAFLSFRYHFYAEMSKCNLSQGQFCLRWPYSHLTYQCLKELSMILTTSFYDMNQKILTKKKGYFQNFSWFQFYIYKLCMIMCIGIAR